MVPRNYYVVEMLPIDLLLIGLWQEPAPVTKRDYCINELVETEKNYIDALAMIINVSQSVVSIFIVVKQAVTLTRLPWSLM